MLKVYKITFCHSYHLFPLFLQYLQFWVAIRKKISLYQLQNIHLCLVCTWYHTQVPAPLALVLLHHSAVVHSWPPNQLPALTSAGPRPAAVPLTFQTHPEHTNTRDWDQFMLPTSVGRICQQLCLYPWGCIVCRECTTKAYWWWSRHSSKFLCREKYIAYYNARSVTGTCGILTGLKGRSAALAWARAPLSCTAISAHKNSIISTCTYSLLDFFIGARSCVIA